MRSYAFINFTTRKNEGATLLVEIFAHFGRFSSFYFFNWKKRRYWQSEKNNFSGQFFWEKTRKSGQFFARKCEKRNFYDRFFERKRNVDLKNCYSTLIKLRYVKITIILHLNVCIFPRQRDYFQWFPQLWMTSLWTAQYRLTLIPTSEWYVIGWN